MLLNDELLRNVGNKTTELQTKVDELKELLNAKKISFMSFQNNQVDTSLIGDENTKVFYAGVDYGKLQAELEYLSGIVKYNKLNLSQDEQATLSQAASNDMEAQVNKAMGL